MSDDRMATLEARIRELEDAREIKDVFFNFHNACTGGFNGKQAGRMEALEMLTDDATIEVQGLHEPGKGPRGRDEVTQYWEYYYGDAGPLPYVYQTSVSEKIEVHGDTAVEYSTMLIFAGFRDAAPTLALSQRINDYRRTEQGWRIYKTTIVGGYHVEVNELKGNLNALPELAQREAWTYKGS